MAQPPLSVDLARQALEAVQHYGTPTAAAMALGVRRTTLNSRLRAAQQLDALGQLYRDPDPLPPRPSGSRVVPLTSFEEAWAQWQQCIGMAQDRYTHPPQARGADAQKILVVPDLHAPFHEPEMFAAMLTRDADADHAICIGDLGDAYALSRFLKYEHMPYRDEWASVTLVMQELAARFPKVTVVVGNHDARLEKQLRTHLTEDMVNAISFMTGGILCPITALAKRYPNVEVAKHVTPNGTAVDWCTVVGDAWLGHPEKFSRVPGSALRFVEEWISDQEAAMGFERYRLIVVGHTHQFAAIPWHADKLLVECGCLAKQQGYMTAPKIGGRPQRRGYLTFTQTNGRTDLNSVRWFGFDWAEQAA